MNGEKLWTRLEVATALLPIAVAVAMAYGRTREIPAIKGDVVALKINQAKTETARLGDHEILVEVRGDIKTLLRRHQ